jgi:hypothetical protein
MGNSDRRLLLSRLSPVTTLIKSNLEGSFGGLHDRRGQEVKVVMDLWE